MAIVKIPATFYQDHAERDLPTPVAVRRTRTHVWIDTDDPCVPELISDARFYGDPVMTGEFWETCRGVVMSARATLRALGVSR